MHNYWMLQSSLEFHIKQNDYFGTLATVLDQVAQDLRKGKQKRHAATLQRLRNDLTHLQSNSRIEKGRTKLVTPYKTANLQPSKMARY
jgi:hypothetical protein